MLDSLRISARRTLAATATYLLTIGVHPLPAQARVQPDSRDPRLPRIEVSADRPLRFGLTGFPVVEPSLAVDPVNVAHRLVGATVIRSSDLAQRSCASLASFDAGVTWHEHVFPVTTCGDPWVALLPDGGALFAMIGDSASSLLVFHSPDGGKSWRSKPTHLGRWADHGTLVVDTTHGPHAGAVYVTSEQSFRDSSGPSRSAVLVARSDDGGVTFEPSHHITPANLWLTPDNPVVLSDGTLIISWGDFGRTTPEGNFALLSVGRDYVESSRDGGASYSPPLYVGSACGRSFPYLAVDGSRGRFRDRLYWVCNDSTYQRVLLFHSADRGERWSEPMLVNVGAGSAPYGRNAVVAVNKDGVVGISWYDGRENQNLPAGVNRCQNLFFTASLDGGVSFLPAVKVSSKPNCPNAPANGGAAKRWPAGGDYHGIATAADGRFHLVWADSRDGRFALRRASVGVIGESSR